MNVLPAPNKVLSPLVCENACVQMRVRLNSSEVKKDCVLILVRTRIIIIVISGDGFLFTKDKKERQSPNEVMITIRSIQLGCIMIVPNIRHEMYIFNRHEVQTSCHEYLFVCLISGWNGAGRIRVVIVITSITCVFAINRVVDFIIWIVKIYSRKES